MTRLAQKGGYALVAALLLAGCAEQRFQLGFQTDTQSPFVTVVNSAGDTMDVSQGVGFTISARDNLGLKNITVSLRGGMLLDTVITFTSAVTTVDQVFNLVQGTNSSVGGLITIVATVIDGNNNTASDTGQIFVVNLKALLVTVFSPTVGAVTSPGKQIPILIRATQAAGIQRVGWIATQLTGTGVGPQADSLLGLALPDTAYFADTLTVPATAGAGTFSVTGFAVDSASRRVVSAAVVVTVLLVVTDTTGPIVTFTVPQRAEARDSIVVRAKDPSGISSIGWIALSSTGATLATQTTAFGGTLTDVSVTNNLNLPLTAAQFPALVILKAWATDGAVPPNTDSAHVDTLRSNPVLNDTILVVNGLTKPLPAGGRVADAIYNRNQNRVYLTNIDLDRLEVFDVTDTSFKTAIPVGSRPWGIALWPRDTLGNNADTVVVANSGGTDLSIVDVSLGQQRRRAQLPIFRVQTVRSTINGAGVVEQQIVEYSTSDRPEYIGIVCRGSNTCKPGGAGDVLAVYSTTPTLGQSTPLPRRGTVRWENLTGAVPESHFLWEQASATLTNVTDTLQLLVHRGPSVPEELLLGALCGRIVNKLELGYLDTTFVRNSGNFTRVIIGEGGSSGQPALLYARAVSYDVTAGLVTNACGTQSEIVDLGVAAALEVRSFISNTSVPVRSVGINFNGFANLIRADSVYVLDRNLRLKGLLTIAGPNWGMDLNFNHDFDPSTGTSINGTVLGTAVTKDDRIAFVTSPDPQIDLFDTFYFGKIGSIPIRDPVIGPLRVAKLPSGEQILVGVTARGVVTVRVPAVTNSFPSKQWPGGQP